MQVAVTRAGRSVAGARNREAVGLYYINELSYADVADFLGEDIASLDDDQIQEIIACVGRDDLTVALAATEPVRDRILGTSAGGR